MIVGGYLDLAAGQLLYRVIPSVVTEFQLEGLTSKRNTRDLMAQADSKDRLPSHQPQNVIDRVGARFRISWSVRQEYTVGLQGQHVLRRHLRWDDCHLAAFSSQLAQDVLLDPEIVSHYVKPRRLVLYADHFVG